MTRSGLELIDPEGRWDFETDSDGRFCWTKTLFQINVGNIDCDFITIEIATPKENTHISVQFRDNFENIPLALGWQKIDVATRGDSQLVFKLNKPFQPRNDSRQLGLMIRNIQPHRNKDQHRAISGRQKNIILNELEYTKGVEVLSSFPPYLRITLSRVCNIANAKPCVYCSWEWAKKLEGTSPDFSLDFIENMGGFLYYAAEITDCSYGEPTLESKFEEFLDILTSGFRKFEFTSNGQTLTKKIRKKLFGKNTTICVSMDSATNEGYSRYRNKHFGIIVDHLKALCVEKKLHSNLPRVVVSFIVMHSNQNEIRDFLKLMKKIGVDAVIFRSLFREPFLETNIIDHDGYRFDYQKEYLQKDELKVQAQRCKALSREYGVEANIEWDSFVQNQGGTDTNKPLCSEPWKAAYILNRGIMPCCYGRSPFINWEDVNINELEKSLVNAFNSQQFRELRHDLASGRLGKYCMNTIGCPIVKKIKN